MLDDRQPAGRIRSASVGLEARQVPLLVDRFARHEARDHVGDHVAADAVDVVLHALGFEQLVALL